MNLSGEITGVTDMPASLPAGTDHLCAAGKRLRSAGFEPSAFDNSRWPYRRLGQVLPVRRVADARPEYPEYLPRRAGGAESRSESGGGVSTAAMYTARSLNSQG